MVRLRIYMHDVRLPCELLNPLSVVGLSPNSATTSDFSPSLAFSPTEDAIYGTLLPGDSKFAFDGGNVNFAGSSQYYDQNVQLAARQPLFTQPLASSGKRGYDVVDEFMTDFKKKRLSTTYDPALAQRLDEIATFLFDDADSALPPLDAQPVEDLNDLNSFLLQLSNEIDDTSYINGLEPSADFDNSQLPQMDNIQYGLDPSVMDEHGYQLLNNTQYNASQAPLAPTPTVRSHAQPASQLAQPPIISSHAPPTKLLDPSEMIRVNESLMGGFNAAPFVKDAYAIPQQTGLPAPIVPSNADFVYADSLLGNTAPDMYAQQLIDQDANMYLGQFDNIQPTVPGSDLGFSYVGGRIVEHEITTMPYMPARYTMALQQSAPDFGPEDVKIKVEDGKGKRSAGLSGSRPTTTAGKGKVAPAPTPTSKVTPKPTLATTRAPRPSQDPADALLRQFRNLSISSQIASAATSGPKRPDQIPLDLRSKRSRHALLVRMLLTRVGEKLKTVDKVGKAIKVS